MTAIAQKLEHTLHLLPPHTAASLERMVEDAIGSVTAPPPAGDAAREERIRAHREHIQRCLDLAGALDWSDFERPPQGEHEVREDW